MNDLGLLQSQIASGECVLPPSLGTQEGVQPGSAGQDSILPPSPLFLSP